MKALYLKLFIVLLATVSESVLAQPKVFNPRKRYWSFGLNAGTSNYRGDLAPDFFDLKMTRPTVGIDVTRRLYPNWSVRGGISWVKIAGDDYISTHKKIEGIKPDSPQNAYDLDVVRRFLRNMSFRNNMIELSAAVVYDFLPNTGYYMHRRKWAPYVSAGVSLLIHEPEARIVTHRYALIAGDTFTPEQISEDNRWIKLRPLKTENVNYSKTVFAVPLGAGLRYAVSDKINLGLEFNYRLTFSDYLDDVSGRYADIVGNDPVRRAMANRSVDVYSAGGEERSDLLLYAAGFYGKSKNTMILFNDYTYSDGNQYLAVNGFTHDNGDVYRGNPKTKDQFLTTTLRFEYVIGPGPSKPKFR